MAAATPAVLLPFNNLFYEYYYFTYFYLFFTYSYYNIINLMFELYITIISYYYYSPGAQLYTHKYVSTAHVILLSTTSCLPVEAADL